MAGSKSRRFRTTVPGGIAALIAAGVTTIAPPGITAARAASGGSGACILATGLAGGARNTAPGGSAEDVAALNIISVSALNTPAGGFTARLNIANLGARPPANGDYMTWAFHWYVTSDVIDVLYASASVPSADPTAPPGTVDYEIGSYDSNTDTYTLITATSGSFVEGPDGHIDIQVPQGSTSLSGGLSHPTTGDTLAGIFANSYVGQNPGNLNNPAGGRTQVDRAPKSEVALGASYVVGSSCSGQPGAPATTWTYAGGGPPGRQMAAAAYDPTRGYTVAFGGQPEDKYTTGLLGDTWVFDGVNWTRRLPATSPTPRLGAVAAYDADIGRVVLFGGIDDSGNPLADTWSWSGAGWDQVTSAALPPGRAFAGLAFDPIRHALVLFGGTRNDSGVELGDTWLLGGAGWSEPSPDVSPPARYQAGMTYDAAAGEIVLFGGWSNASGTALADTWTWNGSWTLVQANPPISARAEFSLAYDPGLARVVLFGGTAGAATWTWDQVSGWAQLTPATPPDNHLLANLVYDSSRGALYLLFGVISGAQNNFTNGAPDFRVFSFSGTAWTELPANTPSPRYKGAMAFDPTIGRYVLFGGFERVHGALADTWLFDGGSWTRVNPAHSPPPTSEAAMAYDGSSGGLLLFGGCCGTPSNQTWLFDGSDWSRANPATSPPGRSDASMAWDPATSSVLLFGGVGTDLYDDSWSWRSGQWTLLTAAHQPTPRDRAAMAYDARSGRMVLFGGFGGFSCQRVNNIDYCSAQSGDSWTWDGADWTDATPATSPQPRELGRLAYDSDLGGLVLFGGFFGGLALQDTWLWRDGGWQQLGPLQSPDPAYGHVILGSALGGGPISFGGLYDAQAWRLSAPAPIDLPEARWPLGLGVVGMIATMYLRRRLRRLPGP